jgi:hypothetical protein
MCGTRPVECGRPNYGVGSGLEQIRLSEVSSPLLRREVIRHNMNALPKRNPRTEAPDPVSGVKKTHPLEEITTLGWFHIGQWSKEYHPKAVYMSYWRTSAGGTSVTAITISVKRHADSIHLTLSTICIDGI